MRNLLLFVSITFLLINCKKESNEIVKSKEIAIVPFTNQNILLGVSENNEYLFRTIDLNTNKVDSFYGPDKSIFGIGGGISYTIDKNDSLYIQIYRSHVCLINFITKVVKNSFPLNLKISKIFYSDISKKVYGISTNSIDSTVNFISIDLKLKTSNVIKSKIKVSDAFSFSDIESVTAMNSTTDDLYLAKEGSLLIINPLTASVKKSIPLTYGLMQIAYNANNGLIYGLCSNFGNIHLAKLNPNNGTIQYNALSTDIRAYSGKCACITSDGRYVFRRAENYISLVIVNDDGQIMKEIPTDMYCIVSY